MSTPRMSGYVRWRLERSRDIIKLDRNCAPYVGTSVGT